jgi:hypothetical protein
MNELTLVQWFRTTPMCCATKAYQAYIPQISCSSKWTTSARGWWP